KSTGLRPRPREMATTTQSIPGQGIPNSQALPSVVTPAGSEPAHAPGATGSATPQRIIDTPKLVAAMLKGHGPTRDLLFSPGRAPQIEVNGQLVEMKFKSLECLTPADTKRIAYDLMDGNETPIKQLETHGSADLSYGLNGLARFRVNIFRQRGSHA